MHRVFLIIPFLTIESKDGNFRKSLTINFDRNQQNRGGALIGFIKKLIKKIMTRLIWHKQKESILKIIRLKWILYFKVII